MGHGSGLDSINHNQSYNKETHDSMMHEIRPGGRGRQAANSGTEGDGELGRQAHWDGHSHGRRRTAGPAGGGHGPKRVCEFLRLRARARARARATASERESFSRHCTSAPPRPQRRVFAVFFFLFFYFFRSLKMRKNMPLYLYKHGNASADTTSSSRPPPPCIILLATSFAAPSSASTSLNAFALKQPSSSSNSPSSDPPPLCLWGPALAAGNAGTMVKPC
jgi:hypothetical protein